MEVITSDSQLFANVLKDILNPYNSLLAHFTFATEQVSKKKQFLAPIV